MLKNLIISSLVFTPSLAFAEPYFKLGILWSTYGPKIEQSIVTTGDEKTERTITSLIDENKSNITGNDSDRVTAIVPRIADVTASQMALEYYGASIGGNHIYDKKLTKSLKYQPLLNRAANFAEPIPALEGFGTIKSYLCVTVRWQTR